MANSKAKTIKLLLNEGNLNGVISIEDSKWNSGELYSAPRESVSELLKTDACNKFGVYLLLSQDMVYVGQSTDLAKRITQHIIGKDWWQSAVILTTKDNSFNHSHIDYLESVLIEKAFQIGKLDCENKNKGNKPKVDKFDKVGLDQYLDEALFLMQLIGITVFSDCKEGKNSARHGLIQTIDIKTKLAIGKRAKTDAIQFLSDNGIVINKKASYAVRQPGNGEYWINPQSDFLQKEWFIVLNDNVSMNLIVLAVPAATFSAGVENSNRFAVRADRPNLLDLRIDGVTFSDKHSGADFAPYIIKKISYMSASD